MASRDPNSVATIYANNQRFTAWKSVMVQRSFGTGYSTFQFTAAETNYGASFRSLQIQPGDPVTIALAGQLAFSGWCATRAGAYDAKSHEVVIAGESKTVDLAHASVVIKPGTYDGSTVIQAVQSVIAPHGLGLVVANAPDGALLPFAYLSPQYGETCAEFISRITAARNMYVTDNAQGQLVIGLAEATTPATTLVEGQNILRASFKLNDPSSRNWFKLQGASQTPGSDDNYPSRAYSASAIYTGARPNLYGLYIANQPSNSQEMVTGITHQAFRSLWYEIEVEVTVPGWLRPDGKLWAPAPDGGATVSIYSPKIFPNAAGLALLAIQAVRFGQNSEEGTTTTLTLRRTEALTHAKTAGSSDAAAVPSVSPDAPDYQTST